MNVNRLTHDASKPLLEVPDTAAFQEDVALRAARAEAEADVKAGRLISHAEMTQHLQQWLPH